jgi:hypothetical protein
LVIVDAVRAGLGGVLRRAATLLFGVVTAPDKQAPQHCRYKYLVSLHLITLSLCRNQIFFLQTAQNYQ